MSHFEDEEIDYTIEFLDKVKQSVAGIIGHTYGYGPIALDKISIQYK